MKVFHLMILGNEDLGKYNTIISSKGFLINRELEGLGRELAKRCGGLPVAVTLLGGQSTLYDCFICCKKFGESSNSRSYIAWRSARTNRKISDRAKEDAVLLKGCRSKTKRE